MSKNQGSRRRLPRPGTVLAAIAVFAVLAGTATAAKTVINGKQIKKGTITAKQIKNKSLGANKLTPGAVKQLRGNQGPRGPQGERGERGAQGERGVQGPAGIVAPLSGSDDSTNIADGDEELLVSFPATAPGSYVISAKLNLFAVQVGTDVECTVRTGAASADFGQWTAADVNVRTTLSLLAVANVGQGENIQLRCSFDDGNGSAYASKLVAIPVS